MFTTRSLQKIGEDILDFGKKYGGYPIDGLDYSLNSSSLHALHDILFSTQYRNNNAYDTLKICEKIAAFYHQIGLKSAEENWLSNIINIKLHQTSHPGQTARLLYENWPYCQGDEKKTTIDALKQLAPKTTCSAQLALANIYLQQFQESKDVNQLEDICAQFSLLQTNYSRLPEAPRDKFKTLLKNVMSLEESKEEKLNNIVRQSTIFFWNANWQDYAIKTKEKRGMLSKLFSNKSADAAMAAMEKEYRKAVSAFFDKEDKTDKHLLDAAFGFEKIADQTNPLSDAEAKRFSAICYYRAALAQSHCAEKKEIYCVSASRLFLKAHQMAHEVKSDAIARMVKSFCNLAPTIADLKEEQQAHYTSYLLTVFSREAETKNLENLQLLSQTLLLLVNKKPLFSDSSYWFGILNELTEIALKQHHPEISQIVIALFNKVERFKNSFSRETQILFSDKFADLLVDPAEVLLHRKSALSLINEEKTVTSRRLETLHKKYEKALVSLGDYYRTHAKPSEAKAVYEEAMDTYHAIPAYLGLAKLASSSAEKGDYLLFALGDAYKKKNAEELKIVLQETGELLLPLVDKDIDRIKMETALCGLFEETFDTKTVATPTPCVKMLGHCVHQWLQPGARCPVSEESLNKMIMTLLNSAYKKESSLLKLIANYSLKRTGASKDEIARKSHLLLSEQSGISLREKRELLGRVIALDTAGNPLAHRIAEISFILAQQDELAVGLLEIVKKAREDKIVNQVECYREGINHWINRFANTETIRTEHDIRKNIFQLLIEEEVKYSNPIATYAVNALHQKYSSQGDVMSLALALKLNEKKWRLTCMNFVPSTFVQRLALLRKILRQDNKFLPSPLLDDDYPEGYSYEIRSYKKHEATNLIFKENAYRTNAIIAWDDTNQAMLTSPPNREKLILCAKEDALPALFYLMKEKREMNSVLWSIKVLILTANIPAAMDRHQATEEEVVRGQREALSFLSSCANDAKSGLQEVAVFGMELFANPELSNLMAEGRFLRSQDVIQAALQLSRLKNDSLWKTISSNRNVFYAITDAPSAAIARKLDAAPLPVVRKHEEEKKRNVDRSASSSSSTSLRSTR